MGDQQESQDAEWQDIYVVVEGEQHLLKGADPEFIKMMATEVAEVKAGPEIAGVKAWLFGRGKQDQSPE